jgi:hypothetical protein
LRDGLVVAIAPVMLSYTKVAAGYALAVMLLFTLLAWVAP